MCMLEDKKQDIEVVEYLHTPPTQAKIKELLKMLGIKAEQLVRKNETIFKEKFEGKKLTQAQWIKAMSEFPILIERPILVKGNKAIIGRPPEIIKDFLK